MECVAEFEEFVPLRSSLERERCTLHQLNSSEDRGETDVTGFHWNGWKLDNLDRYLELPPLNVDTLKSPDSCFQRSDASMLTETFPTLGEWNAVFKTPSPTLDSCRSKSVIADYSKIENKLENVTHSAQIEEVDQDFVVLGVGLESLSSVRAVRTPSACDKKLENTNLPTTDGITRLRGETMQQWDNVNQGVTKKVVRRNNRRRVSRNQVNSCKTPADFIQSKRTDMFTCPYPDCNQQYLKKSHMHAHLRRHTGEKPFACTQPDCSWRFSRSDELRRHERSHSGVKPYLCSTCDRRFSRSDHLSKHIKVHLKDSR